MPVYSSNMWRTCEHLYHRHVNKHGAVCLSFVVFYSALWLSDCFFDEINCKSKERQIARVHVRILHLYKPQIRFFFTFLYVETLHFCGCGLVRWLQHHNSLFNRVWAWSFSFCRHKHGWKISRCLHKKPFCLQLKTSWWSVYDSADARLVTSRPHSQSRRLKWIRFDIKTKFFFS